MDPTAQDLLDSLMELVDARMSESASLSQRLSEWPGKKEDLVREVSLAGLAKEAAKETVIWDGLVDTIERRVSAESYNRLSPERQELCRAILDWAWARAALALTQLENRETLLKVWHGRKTLDEAATRILQGRFDAAHESCDRTTARLKVLRASI